jgi:hypothetical protein
MLARFDFLDHTLFIIKDRNFNPIADGGQVTFTRATFQSASQFTN